jgi:RimJ/RimL family protein N-acetyltransferase
MTEAVRGVVRHAFASYDLERLEAPVFEWNPGSMRVLEKCGFVREAVLHKSAFKDGQLIDMMLYACVREPSRITRL